MKYITEVTRRDIFDIIKEGFVIPIKNQIQTADYGWVDVDDTEEIKMRYCGRLDEISFLQRLYPLDNMPSTDRRFRTALGDIRQHTLNNDDWDYCWVFSDNRFDLSNGNDDEPLLNFLCEMLHPAVRDDKAPWKEYLKKFNELLSPDGYELYEKSHISGRAVYDFRRIDFIETDSLNEPVFAELKTIGVGAYAVVSKYYDKRYDKWFALKKAKKDLNEKEIIRFKREYDDMKKLNSPYVLEVYNYDETKMQYTMELADFSLEKYITENNDKLTIAKRYSLISQILKAFEYIHSKGLYHRDICPKNILIKTYDDTSIIKIADFGLVKEKESELTSDSSEIKGYFNDPTLKIDGFSNYGLIHEIYALTQTIVFVLTGKSHFDKIKDEKILEFLHKGTNPNKEQRYQSIEEMEKAFYSIRN